MTMKTSGNDVRRGPLLRSPSSWLCILLSCAMWSNLTSAFTVQSQTVSTLSYAAPSKEEATLFSSHATSNLSKTALFYSSNSNIATCDEQRKELQSRMPTKRSSLSRLEEEFREMLQGMLYTTRELASITNPRLKSIYVGVAASYYEKAVYRAFEVLYEDYLPLRVAGRLIYKKLQQVMQESIKYRNDQELLVTKATGMSLEEADACWLLFVELSEGREMEMETVEQVLNLLDNDKRKYMLSRLNSKRNKSLTFEELLCGLHSVLDSEDLSLATLLSVAAKERRDRLQDPARLSKSDQKRARYAAKYDMMLDQFAVWKNRIPENGQGRRFDILKGCFVGSENPEVVAALRVIYTDYSALRVSGDWIFSVVSALMNKSGKKG